MVRLDDDALRARVGAPHLGLAAGNNVDLLAEQTARYKPTAISITNPANMKPLADKVGAGVEILSGDAGLLQLATLPEADIVLIAIVGRLIEQDCAMQGYGVFVAFSLAAIVLGIKTRASPIGKTALITSSILLVGSIGMLA